MGQYGSGRGRRFSAVLLLMVSAAALGACQSRNSAGLTSTDPMATGTINPGAYKQAAKLADAYQSDPANPDKALAYANALGTIGQSDKQLDVLRDTYSRNPGDARVAVVYGKKLVAAGRGAEAIPVLEGLAAAATADWRLHSALGSAYDQDGQFEQARRQYTTALQQKPDEMGVLNNLGMSYIMQGDLKTAETTLRKAYATPAGRSESRIRQNLALAVGLQGRFDEARTIASEDLPQDQVDANMAYLKKMLSQSNTWQQLSNGQG